MKPFIFDMIMYLGVAMIIGLLGVGAVGLIGSFFDYKLTNEVAMPVCLAFTLSSWIILVCSPKPI